MAELEAEANPWQSAAAANGELYWYHTRTKQTTWQQPEDAKWRIHKTEDGRKYYEDPDHNVSWERPSFLGPDPAVSQQVAIRDPDAQRAVGHPARHREHQPAARGDDTVQRGGKWVPPVEPEVTSYAQAEAAFIQLMQKNGVEPGWTYDRMCKACVSDINFRAIRDPKDRVQTFKKYIQDAEAQSKEREAQRLATLRRNFNFMLESHPEIYANTSWEDALQFIQGETIFRSTDNEEEKRKLYEEYIDGLRESYIQEQDSARKAAIHELPALLESLKIKPISPFNDVYDTVTNSEGYLRDPKFGALSKVDILHGFEKYGNSVEQDSNASKVFNKDKDLRHKRHVRENFIRVIQGLRRDGAINVLSTYDEVRPLVKSDPSYTAQFDIPGMRPAEVYWDLVDEEHRKTVVAAAALRDSRSKDPTSLSLREFADVLKRDHRTRDWDEATIQTIRARMAEEVRQREKRSSREYDRTSKRTQIDRLRHRIKHLDPPVRINDSWRDVRRRVEHTEEYRALESDDERLQAFDKHIRRMKDKDANGRTPDANAYEADRRKAEEKRERQQYRRSGTGLSPPPSRSSDRYDSRSFSDRRGRDTGRMFSGSRADPLDESVAALDYDDGGSVVRSPYSRKRRESSHDDRRYGEGGYNDHSSKRRRESGQSVTPKDTVKETARIKEEEYKSGSEEGEIEE